MHGKGSERAACAENTMEDSGREIMKPVYEGRQIDAFHKPLLGFAFTLFLKLRGDEPMALDVFILGGKRTPMGEYVGALKDISAIDLGAIAAKAALETTNVAPEEIDHTVMGNALQTSGDAIYGARHVALKAEIPFEKPALTVNRLCGNRTPMGEYVGALK